MARRTLPQLERTKATASNSQQGTPGISGGQSYRTFRSILKSDYLVLQHLHLPGQSAAQVAKLFQIVKLGLFRRNTRCQGRRLLLGDGMMATWLPDGGTACSSRGKN